MLMSILLALKVEIHSHLQWKYRCMCSQTKMLPRQVNPNILNSWNLMKLMLIEKLPTLYNLLIVKIQELV